MPSEFRNIATLNANMESIGSLNRLDIDPRDL